MLGIAKILYKEPRSIDRFHRSSCPSGGLVLAEELGLALPLPARAAEAQVPLLVALETAPGVPAHGENETFNQKLNPQIAKGPIF